MLKHFLARRWFIVALLVGTVLNIINQYNTMRFFLSAQPSYPKIALTYMVPYFVSSLSAWFQ